MKYKFIWDYNNLQIEIQPAMIRENNSRVFYTNSSGFKTIDKFSYEEMNRHWKWLKNDLIRISSYDIKNFSVKIIE